MTDKIINIGRFISLLDLIKADNLEFLQKTLKGVEDFNHNQLSELDMALCKGTVENALKGIDYIIKELENC